MKLSKIALEAEANALAALFNGGFMDYFDGTQPPSADFSVSTQTLGVTLVFGNPAFKPAVGGVLTANALITGVVTREIKVAWARCYKADHQTALVDLTVGVADSADIIMPTTHLVPGLQVPVSRFSFSIQNWKGPLT